MLHGKSSLLAKPLLFPGIISGKMGSCASVPAFLAGLAVGMGVTYLFRQKNQVGDVLSDYHEENYEFPDPGDECRLVMCIRSDLKMQKGKVAAQCGHAAIAAYVKGLKLAPKMVKRWMTYGGTKITLKIESEQELLALERSAKQVHLLTSVVKDAGQTQVAPGSRTVLAIGPAPQTMLHKVTGHLKLY